jgi:hypothetical protein|tara:strand:- start:122 stop:343 length:222 start_codon:yes stop_codon:yes gene_type:complete
MMQMLNKICEWPNDRPKLVGGAVVLLGLTHFGYGLGITDKPFMMSWLTIGNLAGVTAVLVGGCMLLKKVKGAV